MLKKKGSIISTYDPMIDTSDMPKFSKFDIVIFCVGHEKIKKIPFETFFKKKPYYFDLNNILEDKKISFFKKKISN